MLHSFIAPRLHNFALWFHEDLLGAAFFRGLYYYEAEVTKCTEALVYAGPLRLLELVSLLTRVCLCASAQREER